MSPAIEKCAECNGQFSLAPIGSGAAGYATTEAGLKICYECAARHEIAAFAKARKYTAYLSGDGAKVTTWTGAMLATVISTHPTKRRSADGGFLQSIKAKDSNGALWVGLTAPGMCVNLRRMKS